MTVTAHAYVLESPKTPLVPRTVNVPDPGPTEAVVEVLACGLCHTDLGYADGSVPTRKPLPIVLGHEAVGTVIAAGNDFGELVGSAVLVPAVLPCGQCAFCLSGRGNACPNQKMPGYDIDGAFATHFVVPAKPLVPLGPELGTVNLRSLSVVADAVSTAFQAVRRSGLAPGDLAIVVGAGGVGGFVIQIAGALGAHVVACDIAAERLKLMSSHGAEEAVNLSTIDFKEVRKHIRALGAKLNIPTMRYRIFECSGRPAGQLTAFGLLERGCTMMQVGYTPEKVEVRLSNLMAFDATIHGTWGCPTEAYPEVLRMIAQGQVKLEPFVEHGPMSKVNDYLDAMAAHRLERRVVMDPRT